MARSADPDRQATRAIKACSAIGTPRHGNRDDGKIHGLGTQRQYEQIFRTAATWFNERYNVQLYHLTTEQAQTYLQERSVDIGQKQLNNEHRALQMYLRIARKDEALSIERARSEVPIIEKSRAYTDDQIRLVCSRQTDRLSLSTRVADTAGLRAAELYTLRRLDERAPSVHRSWSGDTYQGRDDWQRYSVVGKGGLVREVRLPSQLSQELEATRLAEPKRITDRGIHIQAQYDVIGGKSFSNLFSRTAQKAMGWSEGAHGLRHSYAQRRMATLQVSAKSYQHALGIVSQELGHFRPDITEVYLR